MKRNLLVCILVYLGVFFVFQLNASVLIDQKFNLKKVGVFVINPKNTPVYSEAIESTVIKLLNSHNRFEFAEAAYKEHLPIWKTSVAVTLGSKGKINIPGSIVPNIVALGKSGADSVILAELKKTDDQYQLLLAWLTTSETPETVASTELKIDNRLTVDSFSTAATVGFDHLMTSLPFHGTILSRDGYRIIIDRGAPESWKDRIIPIYTMDMVDGELNLIETGLVQITQPQENISFGKVVAENRPFQIEKNQKFKFVDPAKFDDHLTLMRPDVSRHLASVGDEWFVPTRRLGFIDVDMGASVLSFSQLSQSGKGASSDNVIYPDGRIRGELWVTRSIFFDASLGVAMASVTPSTTSESIRASHVEYQGQIGYRFRLQKTQDPSLYIKTGIYNQHVQVETTSPLAYTSTTFSGLLSGAGARFPIRENVSIHFEVNTLLFPNFEEAPVTSGAETTSISLMQFSVGFTYRLSDVIDLGGSLEFFSAGAELSGKGTRPEAIASIQHSSQTLTFGARYYF